MRLLVSKPPAACAGKRSVSCHLPPRLAPSTSLTSPSLPTPPADMRGDIQEIFKKTPHDKQVMMFSATLSKEIRPVCKKFMTNVRLSSPSRVALAPACARLRLLSVAGRRRRR